MSSMIYRASQRHTGVLLSTLLALQHIDQAVSQVSVGRDGATVRITAQTTSFSGLGARQGHAGALLEVLLDALGSNTLQHIGKALAKALWGPEGVEIVKRINFLSI